MAAETGVVHFVIKSAFNKIQLLKWVNLKKVTLCQLLQEVMSGNLGDGKILRMRNHILVTNIQVATLRPTIILNVNK